MNEINVTSAQYYVNPMFPSNGNAGIEAVIDGETVHVPIAVGNRHYDAIKAKHDDPDDSFTIADAS